jgi:signal transduction histidine kinase
LRLKGTLSKNNTVMNFNGEVRDNGIGMSEAFQKVLFEPFAKKAGSMSRKLAAADWA